MQAKVAYLSNNYVSEFLEHLCSDLIKHGVIECFGLRLISSITIFKKKKEISYMVFLLTVFADFAANENYWSPNFPEDFFLNLTDFYLVQIEIQFWNGLHNLTLFLAYISVVKMEKKTHDSQSNGNYVF